MKPYPSYKDSRVEWIGEIPIHWKTPRIRYIGNLKSGNGFPDSLQGKEKGDYPFYKVSDTNNLGNEIYLKISNNYVTEETVKEYRFNILKPETIVFPKIGMVLFMNKRRLTTTFSIIDNNLMGLELNQTLNSKYYYYLFTQIDFKDYCSDGTVPSIGESQVGIIKVLYPPLPEQHQIVSFLDTKTHKIDELIEKTEKKIELLREKRTSLINHCVTKGLNPNVEMKDSGVEWIGEMPRGWDIKKVKYLGIIKSGDGVVNTELDDNKEYPVYGGNGIMGYYNNFNREETILVIGRVGEKCGNVHLVNEKCWVTDNSLILSLHYNGFYDWVHYSLDTRNLNTLRNQNAQPLITSTQLKNESIPFPSEKEQPQIVEYLDEQTQKIDSTIEKETQRIELLKEYRHSLISEVVTGKIDVRDEVVV